MSPPARVATCLVSGNNLSEEKACCSPPVLAKLPRPTASYGLGLEWKQLSEAIGPSAPLTRECRCGGHKFYVCQGPRQVSGPAKSTPSVFCLPDSKPSHFQTRCRGGKMKERNYTLTPSVTHALQDTSQVPAQPVPGPVRVGGGRVLRGQQGGEPPSTPGANLG